MPYYDLGDVVPLSVKIADATGAPANATSVTCTVTLPDGTTTTPSVVNPTTGTYAASYTPTLAGTFGVQWVALGANASAYSDTFTVAPAAGGIVGLGALKDHLNIADADFDEELRATLAVGTQAVEDHLQRAVSRRARVDTYTVIRGNGSVIVLNFPEAASVDSVVENGTTLPPDSYIADLRTGVLYRDGTTWSPPVVVTWTTTPVDTASVRQAVLEMCRHLWETQRGTSRALPRSGDINNTPSAGYALPNRVAELLAPDRSHT